MVDTDIELGSVAKHRYTRTEGLVTAVSEHLTGCTRVGLRPSSHDNDHNDEEFYAIDALEHASYSDIDHSVETDLDIELGNVVEDQVTGVEGIVVTVMHCLFNCPRVGVYPSVDGDEQSYATDSEWFDAPRLEVVDEGINGEFDDLAASDDPSESGPVSMDNCRKSEPR